MPIIKRYSNRKLYDTQAKRYITLEGIADLVRRGEEILVTDHETGKDITALVKAQTIFDLEKKLRGSLPGTVLTHLIRSGSGRLNALRDVLNPDEANARVDAEIERRVHTLVERGQLDEKEGGRWLELLLAAKPAAAEEIPDEASLELLLKERGVPSRQDWQRLVEQIDALNAELEQLAPQRRPRRAAKSPHPRRKATRAAR